MTRAGGRTHPTIHASALAGVVCLVIVGVAALLGLAACASVPGEPTDTSTVTLVVPRFNGGSVTIDHARRAAFLLHRGYPAGELRLGDTYAPLLDSLQSRAGSEGSVLGASYDWRMPGAPPQATPDGTVDGLLDRWRDPSATDTFAYAVDYLRYWLIQAARVNGDSRPVDVVAHSTGVSVVRAYLQSDAYGQTVLAPDGQQVTLPRIRTLVLAAPPMEGAPFVWNLWNGNFASFVGAARGADVFAGYARAYRHVQAGGRVAGPMGDITRDSLTGAGIARQVSFLRQYNPLFEIVLPTNRVLYPRAAPGTRPRSLTGLPGGDNTLLIDLNSTSTPGHNPWAQLADKVIVTYPTHVLGPHVDGGSEPVQTAVRIQRERGAGGEILPFTAFADPAGPAPGIPTTKGQTWYREIFAPDQGDGAFPLESMQRDFFDATGQVDPGLQVQQWGNGPSPTSSGMGSWIPARGDLTHNLFIENPTVIHWVSQQLQQ